MTDQETLKVYVVRQLGWEYGDDFYYRAEEQDAPVKSFLDPAKAEAERRRREWEYITKRNINPFAWVDDPLEQRSSLPVEELLARLRKLGVDPEAWEYVGDQYRSLSEEQQRQVWDWIDRIRFFEVVEVTVALEP